MIITLLTRGADPTLVDIRGKTPFMDLASLRVVFRIGMCGTSLAGFPRAQDDQCLNCCGTGEPKRVYWLQCLAFPVLHDQWVGYSSS
jgi:hypothetical protein